ncbi:MAG TPA: hypothetical protein VGB55_05850 [Tepidisphaeraceae bacterium]
MGPENLLPADTKAFVQIGTVENDPLSRVVDLAELHFLPEAGGCPVPTPRLQHAVDGERSVLELNMKSAPSRRLIARSHHNLRP